MPKTRDGAPRALIFDLDGTLVDSLIDITGALNEALTSLGFDAVDAARVRTWIGDGMLSLCTRAAAHARAPHHIDALLIATRAAYDTHCTRTTTLYPKMLETLDLLHDAGVPMAVLSNKPHAFVDRLVHHLGLTQRFIAWRGYVCEADKKPSPSTAVALAQMLRADARDVAIVGDSMVDFQTARNAGMRFIAVTWGLDLTEKIVRENPYAVIDSPVALRKIFFG